VWLHKSDSAAGDIFPGSAEADMFGEKMQNAFALIRLFLIGKLELSVV
jgi:hypothetical protein